LASRVEDASERFSAYYGLYVGPAIRGEHARMREMAELFLREAAAQPNCPEILVGHRISGVNCFCFGDFAGAHDHFQKTVELYDPTRHADFANRFGQDPRAAAEIYDTLTLWVLGRIDEALHLADRALTDAESAAHAPTIGYALLLAAFLGLFRYSSEAVAINSQELAEIVSRYDLQAYFTGLLAFFQGWAKRSDATEESRLAEMRRGLAIAREQGNTFLLSIPETALAEAEACAGETDAGLRRLDDALAELERTEERSYEAEMHRIRAEILLKRDPANTAAAEQSLQTAIAIAQSQKARSFELRAALSLAKLYRGQSRRRCPRRAGAGSGGLPADPTIPRTHRGANPPRGTLGKRCGEDRRGVAPATRSPPDQSRQCADLGQGTSGAGNECRLCARPRIGEPGG
jgi:predicted ATPase